MALLMTALHLTSGMSPPPNYSHSNMPTTNFTCSDKATGGYYADPEAGCQMFHVCVRISDEEMNDFRFLCPNNTVFDQQNFICTNWWEINCERSTRYYSKNDLFRVGDQPPEYEYENQDSPIYYEYVYEYVEPEETPKETEVDKTAKGNHHRLSIEKPRYESEKPRYESEKPMARAVETTYVRSTTEKSRIPETSTEKFFFDYVSPETVASTERSAVTATTTPDTSPITTTHRVRIHFESSTTPIRKEIVPTTSRLFRPTTTPETTSTQRSVAHLISKPVVSVAKSVSYSDPLETNVFSSRGRARDQGEASEGKRKFYDHRDEQKLDLNSSDPFSNFDWKKDSRGVTASAKTRYETLFGATSSRGRQFTPREKEPRSAHQHFEIINTEAPHSFGPTSERKQTESQIQRQRQSRQRTLEEEEKQTESPSTDVRHKEFSNFRFYKTAFGTSYSSDDFIDREKPLKPSIRISDPVRLQRTASRSTRYSIYG